MTRIEGQLPDFSAHVPTGFGPWPYVGDTRDAKLVAKVNTDPKVYQDHERVPGTYRGWTRCFRLTDLPRLAAQCRTAGVDPEGAFLTLFDAVWVPTVWVASEADANRLRLAWAREFDVTPAKATQSVDSPNIGADQRAMYQAVLDAA